MRAVCYQGKMKVGVQHVDDPRILNARDAIVRVTSASICGSDLHLYDGFIPLVMPGDILGHEFMGEVVDVGPAVTNLRPGDRVIVPSTISCGRCFFCARQEWSLCDNSNPNFEIPETAYGQSPCGIFGYSHAFGGYAGAFAEFVRVPFADVGPVKVPLELRDAPDERLLFLSDAVPTGYMAADMCDVRPGDVVAVWGAGAVGLFAMKMARLLGAERIVAIDRIPERLALAERVAQAEPIDFATTDVLAELRVRTGGRGPDACIDAVGLEADQGGLAGAYDRTKTTLKLETDRPHVLREAILACRKGGVLSIVGVYAGFVDKIPMGAAMNKALIFRMGQMHGQKYARLGLERVASGQLDPTVVVTHRYPLEAAEEAFETFRTRKNGCVRVVLHP